MKTCYVSAMTPHPIKLISLAFYALSFLGPVSLAQSDQSGFNIGMMLCLTGECAAEGTGALEGARLAVDEINAQGGVLGRKLILVIQDTAEAVSGAKAMNAYRQLRLDKSIRYYIGPTWTPGGLTLAPVVAKEKDIVVATPSLGVKEFHQAGDNLFNVRGTDEVPTRKAAQLAIQRGWKTAAVFSSQQPWESLQGNFFADEFEKLGGKVLIKIEPLPTTATLGTEALKVVAAKPEVIFFSNVVQQAIAAKEIRKLNWSGEKLAAYVDDTRRREADGALSDVMFYTYQMPSDVFIRKYESHYGRKPEPPAGTGYDTIYVYAKAIAAAKSFDPTPVKKEILNLKFDGASGVIQFDKEGCVQKEPRLWKVTADGFEPSDGGDT